MFVDPTLLDIIETYPKAVSVSFLKSGGTRIEYEKDEDSEDEQSLTLEKKMKEAKPAEVIISDDEG